MRRTLTRMTAPPRATTTRRSDPIAPGPAWPDPTAPWRFGHPGVELSGDPAFGRRIRRLASVSVVALGLIWFAATRTGAGSELVQALLLLGWLLMPTLLGLSLHWPRLRYALVVPSLAVGIGLELLCLGGLPASSVAAAGWLAVTGGIWLGGLLGVWFWFRWLPVPAALTAPFAPGRWALIAVHVGLIVGGLALIGMAAWTGVG